MKRIEDTTVWEIAGTENLFDVYPDSIAHALDALVDMAIENPTLARRTAHFLVEGWKAQCAQ